MTYTTATSNKNIIFHSAGSDNYIRNRTDANRNHLIEIFPAAVFSDDLFAVEYFATLPYIQWKTWIWPIQWRKLNLRVCLKDLEMDFPFSHYWAHTTERSEILSGGQSGRIIDQSSRKKCSRWCECRSEMQTVLHCTCQLAAPRPPCLTRMRHYVVTVTFAAWSRMDIHRVNYKNINTECGR